MVFRGVDTVMAQERAASFTKRSIKAESKRTLLTLALSMLDLTTLEGKDSPQKVRGLCAKAARPYPRDREVLGVALPSCAAVCVYPSLVPECVRALRGPASVAGGEHVKIASVATGFPSGQFPLEVRLADVRDAVAAGADEVDMVISRGLMLAGRLDAVAEEVRQTKIACRRGDGTSAHLKVILETGELETLDTVRLASDIAIRAMDDVRDPAHEDTLHVDFIKTSTGKVQPSATMPVTLVMLEAIRDHYLRSGRIVGMKPAGGIRAAKQALHYLVMVHEVLSPLRAGAGDAEYERAGLNPWLTPRCFRFGASVLCNDLLRQLVRLRTGRYAAGYDFSEA